MIGKYSLQPQLVSLIRTNAAVAPPLAPAAIPATAPTAVPAAVLAADMVDDAGIEAFGCIEKGECPAAHMQVAICTRNKHVDAIGAFLAAKVGVLWG